MSYSIDINTDRIMSQQYNVRSIQINTNTFSCLVSISSVSILSLRQKKENNKKYRTDPLGHDH